MIQECFSYAFMILAGQLFSTPVKPDIQEQQLALTAAHLKLDIQPPSEHCQSMGSNEGTGRQVHLQTRSQSPRQQA